MQLEHFKLAIELEEDRKQRVNEKEANNKKAKSGGNSQSSQIQS